MSNKCGSAESAENLHSRWLRRVEGVQVEPILAIGDFSGESNVSILESVVTATNVSFADVIGLEPVKEKLKESVVLPFKFP